MSVGVLLLLMNLYNDLTDNGFVFNVPLILVSYFKIIHVRAIWFIRLAQAKQMIAVSTRKYFDMY